MGECEISVRVTPRAHRDEIVGERDGVLLARVRAPPADGRANEALVRLIASKAGLRVRAVTLVRGGRSRVKVLRVAGLDAAALRAALGLPPPKP